MKKLVLLAAVILVVSSNLKAGWSYHAHINYLKEAISILDYYDYKMCLTYKNDLVKGVTEGEIQYKYRAKGNSPKWFGELTAQEVFFLQGHTIDSSNIEKATVFYSGQIVALKKDIVNMNRPYYEVMYKLGYILHSINNILLPLYEEGHFPEQHLASNTQKLEISKLNISEISDFNKWIKNMIEKKVAMRNVWSNYAIQKDEEGFIQYANEANKMNIHSVCSILKWVVSDCYGPEPIKLRNKLEAMHESRLEKNNGRKKW